MEFSYVGQTPPWLILRLFHFFPLKDQKYLKFSLFSSEDGSRGGYIREKNKSV